MLGVRERARRAARLQTQRHDRRSAARRHGDAFRCRGDERAGRQRRTGSTATSAPTATRARAARRRSVPETAANQIIDWDGATGNPGTSFYALKTTEFDARRAAARIRYALFGHRTNARARRSTTAPAGWAESAPANDFMVSLGGLRDDGRRRDGRRTVLHGQRPGTLVDDDGDGSRRRGRLDRIDNDGDGPAIDEDGGNGVICDHGDFKVDEDSGYSVGTRDERGRHAHPRARPHPRAPATAAART